ncbi:MAG: aldo/keto reductase [Steroidobacteraceae bacterium]
MLELSPLSRRQILTAAAGAVTLGLPEILQAQTQAPRATQAAMLTRKIPSSGEVLPVIGLGTPLIFDYAPDPVKQKEMSAVIAALVAGGGRMIDTANGYGKGEARLGEIIDDLKVRDKIFLATKFTSLNPADKQKASVANSQELLKTKKFDLLYAWGVNSADYDTGYLRELKAQGVTRYIGVTNGRNPDLAAFETLLKREKPDFLYFGYSIGDRSAEERLFPAARDAGVAVVGTVPFGGSSLFSKVAGKPLPNWAGEIGVTSWAQFFLKFVLANPAIVTIVPGTNKVDNLNDNLAAGRGAAPTAAQRQKMIDYWATIA